MERRLRRNARGRHSGVAPSSRGDWVVIRRFSHPGAADLERQHQVLGDAVANELEVTVRRYEGDHAVLVVPRGSRSTGLESCSANFTASPCISLVCTSSYLNFIMISTSKRLSYRCFAFRRRYELTLVDKHASYGLHMPRRGKKQAGLREADALVKSAVVQGDRPGVAAARDLYGVDERSV